MVSRTGILSDDHFNKNCIDYMPMPMGFMNAKYRGNFGNPEFSGIKTPKYFHPVSRPASMDVYASTLAKYMAGNRADNIRTILNELHRQAKDFIPPEISLTRLARDKLDETKNITARPMYFSGSSIGSLLTEASIASQSIPIDKEKKYINIFRNATERERKTMMQKFIRIMKTEKINLKDEGIDTKILKGTATKGKQGQIRVGMVENGLRLLKSKGTNIDLDEIFRKTDESDLSSQITKPNEDDDDDDDDDDEEQKDYDSSGEESPDFSFGKQD
tara:strand:- start:114 stop:935 length:822 start_codon:yes stop_codon:yes gene_type:complete